MEFLKRKSTWRILNMVLATGLVSYAIVAGLTGKIAWQDAANAQTSRNFFYHVPMWFAMMAMGYTAVVYSIVFLRKGDLKADMRAAEAARITLLFGVLGLATGIVWSRVTWSAGLPDDDPAAWWPWDPKQTSALICILIYAGYFVLRSSFDEPTQRARIAAVYNIFAAASIYPLFYVIPKSLESLHPNTLDDESAVRTMSPDYYAVFWPAVVGFVCLAIWLLDLRARTAIATHEALEADDEI